MSDNDRRRRQIKPSPLAVKHTLEVGRRVFTPMGSGKIVNILLAASEWSDTGNGKKGYRLLPPTLVVELDEPWKGETRLTLPLQLVSLFKGDKTYNILVKELWPDQVTEKPPSILRPTTEKSMKRNNLKLSDRIRALAAAKKRCPQCGGPMGNSKGKVCDTCAEEAKGYIDYDFIDPNGKQWLTRVRMRQPLAPMRPYTTGSAKAKGRDTDDDLHMWINERVPKTVKTSKTQFVKWLKSARGKASLKGYKVDRQDVIKFASMFSDKDWKEFVKEL